MTPIKSLTLDSSSLESDNYLYQYLQEHIVRGEFQGQSLVGRVHLSVIDLKNFIPKKEIIFNSYNELLTKLKQTHDKVLVINYLEIESTYRGQNLAHYFLQEVIKDFGKIKIILYPFPLQHLKEVKPSFASDFKKLYSYYQKLGLEAIPFHEPYLELS